jgi:glycosyltransferase A (GT-A) superfamily protein (DUF2064 family)
MTRRVVAVHVRDDISPDSLAAALLEDVVDLVAGMQQVEGALVAAPSGEAAARAAAWPGMAVLRVPVQGAGDTLTSCFAALLDHGADEAAVVSADVPDLPPLLLGKLFSALTTWPVAVCPARDGSLVAVAARLPAPDWLGGIDLDAADGLARLRRAAPSRALHVGAGWHRIRDVTEAAQLDEGLEGWEATRGWLSRRES